MAQHNQYFTNNTVLVRRTTCFGSSVRLHGLASFFLNLEFHIAIQLVRYDMQ